ncbi:PadR family transcriptional regulator [Nocardia otitidiscaviarum]|uniref:PadR family transcriptional regulator n=1 Tax=Nocardia otitidiscaviarum TaxID=1823 RepID=UPI001894591A|nr:PadR family transcriptional regulator [Nocardia otitidiscaviarum]MBF6237586.1 PadR family transcriptional regulator [Nocardia otitidiscaviarum]
MSLRHALLGLLAERPASGYDLLGSFRESLANVWPATQSQIYTELANLAEAGLIAVSDEGPRGRKEYTLTETGRDELRTWLTTTEPKRRNRNDMLLRVFFLGIVPEHARDYLTEIATTAAAAQADLSTLRETTEWGDSDLSRYGRIAMEWGERFHAMNREWAQWALTQLPDPDR